MYAIACVATVLIIFILVNIERLERHANFQWESRIIRVKAHGIIDDLQPCRDIISGHGIHVGDTFVKYDYENQTTIANFLVRTKGSFDASPLFGKLHAAVDAISITLTNEMNL